MYIGETPQKPLLSSSREKLLLRLWRHGSLALTFLFSSHLLAQTTNADAQLPRLESEMNSAVQQVEKIVNQTVPAYPRKPGIHVAEFKEGWFHEGATKPDFNTVDVRASRETPYDKYQYVSSVLNPGLYFIGQQLEFNANTKYFYKNRSVPKKKLTETEMLEINRLYRLIGKCEQEINRIKNPVSPGSAQASGETEKDDTVAPASSTSRSRLLNPYIGIPLLGVCLLILVVGFIRRGH
jgi:hypothetical protein